MSASGSPAIGERAASRRRCSTSADRRPQLLAVRSYDRAALGGICHSWGPGRSRHPRSRSPRSPPFPPRRSRRPHRTATAPARVDARHLLAGGHQARPAAAPLAVGYRHTGTRSTCRAAGHLAERMALGVQRRYADPTSGQSRTTAFSTRAASSRSDRAATSGEPRDHQASGSSRATATWACRARTAERLEPRWLTATPPPERNLPANQRLPRDRMIAIVNSARRHHLARRRRRACAQGSPMRTARASRVGAAATTTTGLGARASISRTQVPHPARGHEQGFVLGMAVFIRSRDRRGRGAFSEWFEIEDGKIRHRTAMRYPGPNGRCRTGRRTTATSRSAVPAPADARPRRRPRARRRATRGVRHQGCHKPEVPGTGSARAVAVAHLRRAAAADERRRQRTRSARYSPCLPSPRAARR